MERSSWCHVFQEVGRWSAVMKDAQEAEGPAAAAWRTGDVVVQEAEQGPAAGAGFSEGFGAAMLSGPNRAARAARCAANGSCGRPRRRSWCCHSFHEIGWGKAERKLSRAASASMAIGRDCIAEGPKCWKPRRRQCKHGDTGRPRPRRKGHGVAGHLGTHSPF